MSEQDVFPSDVIAKLDQTKVVAVLVIDDADHAVPLAKALLDGGVDIMELTLRTPAALAALRAIKAKVPEMTAGIGTIITEAQVTEVKEAGAVFGVAPGFNPRVLAKAKAAGLPFAPGVCTPSEIEWAVEGGCRILKFFPSESFGGLKTLLSMGAPYAHLGLRYIPLGGLNQNNFIDYLKNPSVIAVGGSWIASRDEIKQQNWSAITDKAAAATSAIATLKSV